MREWWSDEDEMTSWQVHKQVNHVMTYYDDNRLADSKDEMTHMSKRVISDFQSDRGPDLQRILGIS